MNSASDGGNLPERLRSCAQLVGSGDELSRRADIPRRTLETYLTGESEPKVSRLVALAQAAGVSVSWLATGRPPVHELERIEQIREIAGASGAVPVTGLADCGLKGWFQESALAVTAARPGDLQDPEAFAVIAVGASMRPAGILAGFLCYCAPGLTADKGDRVLVERSDGAAAIKLLIGQDAEWVHLRGWLDPDEAGRQEPYTESVKRAQVKRLAPVVYIKVKL